MPKPTNFCAVRPSVAFGSTARRLPGWRADCPPGREIGFRPTTSGLPLETDIVRAGRHVSKVPFPDSCIAAKQTLFNHFVRAGEHRCRQIEEERLGGFQIGTWSASAPADQPASLRPLSAQSWAMQERPQRQRPLRPKLRRSCRAVLAGASASVKSDAKCPRCLALHFWI